MQRSINICIQQSAREHAADTAVGGLHAPRLPRRRAAHVAHLRPAAAALRRAVSVRLVNTALYSGFAQLRVLQIRRKPLFCHAQVRFGNVLENLRAAKGWPVPVFMKHRALTSLTSVLTFTVSCYIFVLVTATSGHYRARGTPHHRCAGQASGRRSVRPVLHQIAVQRRCPPWR